ASLSSTASSSPTDPVTRRGDSRRARRARASRAPGAGAPLAVPAAIPALADPDSRSTEFLAPARAAHAVDDHRAPRAVTPAPGGRRRAGPSIAAAGDPGDAGDGARSPMVARGRVGGGTALSEPGAERDRPAARR